MATSASFTELDLGDNEITDVGATKLAEAVARSTSLTGLWLYNNQITDVGALKLAEAVARSTSLTTLNLEYTEITDIGAIAFAKGLARDRSSNFMEFIVSRDRLTLLGRQALDAAHATTKATRPTLWLLTGAPTSSTSPTILWRRFLLDKDGDHAIWARVMDFLSLSWGRSAKGLNFCS